MDAPPDRDTEILRLVLERDLRGAGTLLVRGYADEVYALCSSMTRDTTLAEDLSQEVFTRAFKALPGFRGEASVRTWILRIARNRCIDHLRRENRMPAQVDEEPDAQPAPEPSVADLIVRREYVTAGLGALNETERALVVLRFGHELGYPELADAFGLGQGAVRMRVSRAVTKMRDAVAAGTLGAPLGAMPGARYVPAGPGAPPGAAAPPAPRASRARRPSPARRSLAAAPPSPFARSASTGLRASLERMAGALG